MKYNENAWFIKGNEMYQKHRCKTLLTSTDTKTFPFKHLSLPFHYLSLSPIGLCREIGAKTATSISIDVKGQTPLFNEPLGRCSYFLHLLISLIC